MKASSSEFRCRPRDGDGSGMRGCLDEWDWSAVSTGGVRSQLNAVAIERHQVHHVLAGAIE